MLQQVGAVLGGEAVRLPAAVGRRRGRRRHGGGGDDERAETERRAVGRRGGGSGGEAVAEEESGEHWSWRRWGEGAEKVGEDRRGSGGGHVGCAPSDTCLPPPSAVRSASAHAGIRKARAAATVCVCVRVSHFVVGLACWPCGLCSPYKNKQIPKNFQLHE